MYVMKILCSFVRNLQRPNLPAATMWGCYDAMLTWLMINPTFKANEPVVAFSCVALDVKMWPQQLFQVTVCLSVTCGCFSEQSSSVSSWESHASVRAASPCSDFIIQFWKGEYLQFVVLGETKFSLSVSIVLRSLLLCGVLFFWMSSLS